LSAKPVIISRMWKVWLVAGALALTLVCWPLAGAMAGPQENLARDQVKQAAAAYNLGHFDEAAEHYEEAYRLVPDPILLFNIAQSYRLGGKPDKALYAYRAFLRTAGSDAPNREVVEKHIAELKRQLDENKNGHPEPASATAAAASPANIVAGVPPSTASQPVSPAPAGTFLASARATSPQTATSDSGLSVQGTPGGEPQAVRRPFYKAWWFWTAVGGAVVAGTVTAFLVGRGTKNGCSGEPLTCVGIQ
jgi:tetratricopeptide (TPR) repeat protein